jgi:glycosyltransferase involved in cell wall biosynthesis
MTVNMHPAKSPAAQISRQGEIEGADVKSYEFCIRRGLHLAVDAVGIKHSGGATVLQDFIRAALADERLARLTVFTSPRVLRNFSLPDSEKLVEVSVPAAERSRLYRMWWLECELPKRVRRLKPDVLLCMTGAGRAPRGVPHATFVQQSLPFSSEAQARFARGERVRLKSLYYLTRRACHASQAVLVQTPTMQNCLTRAFRLPEGLVRTILPAVGVGKAHSSGAPELESLRQTPPGLRLLYVGNQSPYKNVELVARAMSRLRLRVPGATLFLTWPADHPLTRLPGVVGCGYLSDTALGEAYRLSTILVMPSLIETVGLPILEALSVGTPVLAADRPYAHDVCGVAAAFFDPLDAEHFVTQATNLLNDPSRLHELSIQGLALTQTRRAGKPYEQMVASLIALANI